DPDGDTRLAVKALRRAVGIDPHEPRSWATLGTAALRAADDRLACKAFRRAARLRPERIDTPEEGRDGVLAPRRQDGGRPALNTARFASQNDASLTALWDRFRFALALRQQHGPDHRDTVLPFPVEVPERIESETHPVVLRADRRSTVKPHLLRLFGRRS